MFVFGRKRWWWYGFALLVALGLLAGCGNKSKPERETEQTASAEQLRQVELLNAAADEMYRYVMDGDIDKARDKLEQIGGQITRIRFDGIASVEGVGALTESVVQAKRVYQSMQVTPEQGQAAAAKIRLATDALTHANQPMWLQYYKAMKDHADGLAQAVQLRNKSDAEEELRQLQFRYDTIRPSLLINRQPADVEKLDSLFVFLRSQLTNAEFDPQQMSGALGHLHQTLDELFQRTDRTAYMPMVVQRVPGSWMVMIGSIIVAVLSFAAWRIFDFERNTFGGNRHGGR